MKRISLSRFGALLLAGNIVSYASSATATNSELAFTLRQPLFVERLQSSSSHRDFFSSQPTFNEYGARGKSRNDVCLVQMSMVHSRSSDRWRRDQERSKRQERVGHLVRAELAKILRSGYEIKYVDWLDDDLRHKISVVNADLSPDLRQARVTVSILGTDTVDKRRAYSWLVKSTKMIRHALAKRLSHMKFVPNLSFVQADVGAAVDVMDLIDKISQSNYKRKNLGLYGGDDDALPQGVVMGIDFDEAGDDDGWIDEEDEDDLMDDKH